MDIQQMRYVIEVARTGSIRTAAAVLHVAPQSLSEQLRRVERSYGAPLFTRSRSGMTLTEFGKVFVDSAGEAVAAFDRAVEAVRAAAGNPEPARLAWAYGLADVLRKLLRIVVDDYPDQPVTPVPMGCAAQLEALAQGTITAGLAHHMPGEPLPSGIRLVRVDSQPAHALLPQDHRLARQPSVTLAELAGQPLLLPTESGTRCLREWELEEFDRAGLVPRIAGDVSSIELAIATVAAGDGYALCVRTTHPVGEGVRFVPVAGDVRPQQTVLHYTAPRPAALLHAAHRLERTVGPSAT